MQSDLVLELPFGDDTEGYLRFVCAMPAAVVLESGRPGSSEGRFSIYTADPVETIRLGAMADSKAISTAALPKLVS